MGLDRWDDDGGRQARGNGPGRRAEDQLRAHLVDQYAHPALVDRLLAGAAPLRTDYERRLRLVEVVITRLTFVTLILAILLGSIGGVLTARLLGALH